MQNRFKADDLCFGWIPNALHLPLKLLHCCAAFVLNTKIVYVALVRCRTKTKYEAQTFSSECIKCQNPL